MDLQSLNFDELNSKLHSEMDSVDSKEALELFRRAWLGKEGVIKLLFQQLRNLEAEKKVEVAARLNDAKARVEDFVKEKENFFAAESRFKKLESEFVDLSLPGNNPGTGRAHPLTRAERVMADLLRPFGFRNVIGPEVEKEYYCFDALNIPPHHPARDMQDTFYTDPGDVLRTHTTSVQARVLQEGKLPIRVACFGKCYRNETEDASHTALFHQFEMIWVEEGLTLAHLMGIISYILKGLYGKRRKIRFVPKFYPYTEPSIGPQINCSLCNGKGCPACGGAGWVTVGGAGMVHRKVLEEFKFDPEKVSGLAFGLGSSRLASQFFGIPTIKAVYSNDIRVLQGGEK
ncbi:MAG: phenylalanine--tRNA ligase subunit alpha [SAR324 cluster bacterium]|uniref:Phenylalanine--tRNA ligase alpha subunit n=1 Tax=SAR324 cluster bacterium TaxID=2024889 RepID=A0A7X9IJU6_9DELT|nr:phenylalanine--tRNA ligase subunit alpha [SAR324 cluster bacterium]